MESKWILYSTINNINKNIYVGVHKLSNTSKSKSYLGSGYALGLAIQKYGKENFTRTTLAEFSCAEDAYAAEAEGVSAYVILYRVKSTAPKYERYCFAAPEGSPEAYPPQ